MSSDTIGAVFDKGTFLSNLEGMEELIPDLVNNYIESLPELLSSVERAIASGSCLDLKIAAHTLKGVVSNFFAEPSRLLAYKLEMMGKEQRLEGADTVFKDLVSELAKLSESLKELAGAK